MSYFDVLSAQFHDANPFGVGKVSLVGNGKSRTIDVLIADTPEKRARGMVGRKFHGFDAMLFQWEKEGIAAFHMKGVDCPLMLIAYDGAGKQVAATSLMPDEAYRPISVPFMWAIEAPYEWAAAQDLSSYDLEIEIETLDRGAPEQKLQPEQVNLRTADGDPTCAMCDFYLGGACEIVGGAVQPSQVCDQYTPEDDVEAAKKKKLQCSESAM